MADPRGILYEFVWLWVLVGVFLGSMVIIIIFIIINNKCIHDEVKSKPFELGVTPKLYAQSNKYHTRKTEQDVPPLPPRTQFLTDADSYEEIPELPDYIEVVEEETILQSSPTIQRSSRDKCISLGTISTEDYDDIGMPDDEEDYDDLG